LAEIKGEDVVQCDIKGNRHLHTQPVAADFGFQDEQPVRDHYDCNQGKCNELARGAQIRGPE
jgi:hypothetical protein